MVQVKSQNQINID